MKWCNMHVSGPRFFLIWKAWWDWCFRFPMCSHQIQFPSNSQCIPQDIPNNITCFYPICFTQSCPFIYCISESKWYQSIFQYKLLCWGASKVSIFFVMGYQSASQTSNITKFPWNLCENFEAIVQNLLASKCKNYYIYIYIYISNVSFPLMMFWCEICIIYISTKSLQL
jgi:hypothetical protein